MAIVQLRDKSGFCLTFFDTSQYGLFNRMSPSFTPIFPKLFSTIYGFPLPRQNFSVNCTKVDGTFYSYSDPRAP